MRHLVCLVVAADFGPAQVCEPHRFLEVFAVEVHVGVRGRGDRLVAHEHLRPPRVLAGAVKLRPGRVAELDCLDAQQSSPLRLVPQAVVERALCVLLREVDVDRLRVTSLNRG
jgi:hypothetical protein